MPHGMEHILSDLRVLDFTRALAGPKLYADDGRDGSRCD